MPRPAQGHAFAENATAEEREDCVPRAQGNETQQTALSADHHDDRAHQLSHFVLSAAQTSAPVSQGSAARIGQLAATVSTDAAKDKTTAQPIGIRTDGFIYRQLRVSDGRKDFDGRGAIAYSGLRNDSYRIGDIVTVGSDGAQFTITGFTDGAKLSVTPVIYVPLSAWSHLKLGSGLDESAAPEAAGAPSDGHATAASAPAASAVMFGEAAGSTAPDGTEQLPIGDFIQKLPGYRAQDLTSQFMLVFLFIIMLATIAVFLYILTMQTIPNFAVLKMQGILTRYLILNTIAQACSSRSSARP